MKIILVAPFSIVGKSFVSGCFAPRGLWQIATAVKNEFPKIQIQILDGDLLNQEKIEQTIIPEQPDLLGISSQSLAYPNCLRLINIARKKSIQIIIGGIHATHMHKQIAQNQSVDVIVGKGEKPFVEYLRWFLGKIPKEQVPNLCWSEYEKIIINRQTNKSFRDPLDLDQIDLQPYWKNFAELNLPSEKSFVIFSHEGCKWRELTNGCSFCSLIKCKTFYPEPKKVWQEIKHVLDYYKSPVWFKDFADSFTEDWDFVKELFATKPKEIIPGKDYFLEIYVKSGQLQNQEQADLLRQLGVVRVFVGFESADNQILRLLNKGTTTKKHWATAQLLIENKIEILASFALGLEGEIEKSLRKTLNFAKSLKKKAGSLLKLSSAAPISIFPGSQVWEKLIGVFPEYNLTDNPDLERAQSDWVDNFTNLTGNKTAIIREVAEEINSLVPANHSFAWKKFDKEE